MRSLGIDTSNYTTSVALFDSDTGCVTHAKKLLPVKDGEKGLRQSDAVFHHTSQLYLLIEELFTETEPDFSVIGYSDKPRNTQGSYMPCFTVGINTAKSIAASKNIPDFHFSHQCNHIAAALYSSGKFNDLKNERFIAFHISGGTTEMLLVTPDKDTFFSVEIIGGTLDLNAGQAVDRAGVMMGMKFPCGTMLEESAKQSSNDYSFKIYSENGFFSFSGLENKCKKMLESNEKCCDISKYCLDYIYCALDGMTEYALNKYGDLPLVYSGGVMSNTIIRSKLLNKFNGFFAEPAFSCDNAAGVAIMACERGLNI